MPQKLFLSLTLLFSVVVLFILLPSSNRTRVQNSFNEKDLTGYFNSHSVTVPLSLSFAPLPPKVLGDNTAKKEIRVDLTNQRLYAYEDNVLIHSFLVSTGKWGKTPTGTFKIWGKYRFIKMSGGSKTLHTYYYLPNVPYTLFFSNSEVAASKGFSIHGAYWHNNFGHPMSHGCINMQIPEAAIIYDWANPELLSNQKSTKSSAENPGTEVIIYGTAPSN